MASNWDGWDEEDQQTTSASSNNNTSSNHNSSGNRNNNSRVNDEPPHRNDDLGEAPELPPIFFTYDPITNKLEVRDRRGNVKAEFSVKTEQGASAYDLWVKGRVDGSDTSYTAYMNDMRGKDGKNGKNAFEEWQDSRDPNTDRSWEAYLKFFTGDKGESAFELWKKVHGEYSNPTIEDFFNYFKGKNGKDAYEVWQDMGFKDRSREDFFKWIASLVETQTGEDGKIFYPHFDGYTLYFTEDFEGKGIRLTEKEIRGKDGRTFEPKFEGTKLHFEDGEGTSTIPVELRGKDAFELWKEYHHKPDAKYEEFEEYFKGQNVQATHSYMDVTNWQCPVQEINTDLIVNSFNTAKTPGAFIDDCQKKINALRDEGNKIESRKILFGLKEKKYHTHWGGWFKEFTWWCAGADRSLLRMCPGDHSKYTGIGTVILFTALMAWFSSFIAIQLVFTNQIHIPFQQNTWFYRVFDGSIDIPLAAILFASFWGAMIFFLDRFITNTMYSDGEVTISKQEFLSGLPRILIAIFLGIVISAPLELKIFDKEIQSYIRKDNFSRIEDAVKLNQEYKDTCEDYTKLEQKCDDAYKYWRNLKPSEYTKKDKIIDGQVESGEKVDPSDSTKKEKIYFNKYHNEIVEDKDAYEKAREEAKSVCDNLEQELERYKNVKAQTYENIKQNISTQYNKADNAGLYERLGAMHALAMQGYSPIFAEDTLAVNRVSSVSVNQLSIDDTDSPSKETVNWDLILKIALSLICAALFIILSVKKERKARKERPEIGLKISIGVILSIIAGCLIGWNYELFHYLIYYLTTPIGLIMLLFILIDISPVLYKMMLADGVYDKYLQQEKALVQEKIRLNNAQMLRTVEKGELRSVSPFIMGDVYEDLLNSASDSKNEDDIPARNRHINWSEGDAAYNLDKRIADDNMKVFNAVLDFKKRVVLASYAAWYRDMRDAMIGKKDDDKGNLIKPEIILEETPDSNQGADN
ncbi:MAG: DUF4407 domain-containing protein [Bacteroidales bacterium]|nr:DUF4407 domain-containing protein [Bacteroidales bacterium]